MPRKPKSNADLSPARMATEAARRRLANQTGERPRGWLDFPDWLPVVTPRWTWDWPHQKHLYRILDGVAFGQTDRLIIAMPPRHTKSETVTVRFSSWWLENNPTKNVIVAAHTQKLANKFSRSARAIVRERLPLDDERKAAPEWLTAAGGGMLATGVGGGLPGFGGDLIVLDDPIRNNEEAASADLREKQWDWFNGTLRNRAEPNARFILISTRWHEDDLAGRLIAQMNQGGETWAVCELPALAEDDDPLGRQPGEALCPDRYNREWLLKEQAADPYAFAALYQQRPAPREGGLFQVNKIRTCRFADLPKGLRWVRYWDLAASLKRTASYSASVALAFGPDGTLYCRDMFRKRLEWPDLRREMTDTMLREGPTTRHGIEKALHGLAATQELLRDRRLVHIGIRAIPVEHDKQTRALPLADRLNSGKVVFVDGPWIADCKQELAMFPKGKYGDQVDTLSGGCLMLARRRGGGVTFD